MSRGLWAGVDAGKFHHHCVVVDGEGKELLSKRVANTEQELRELIKTVIGLDGGAGLTWATDQSRGGAALLIAVLLDCGQRVIYLPSGSFHHAAAALPGENKTDARDAYIIANHTRTRTDLRPLQSADEIAVQVRLLSARRRQLVADKTKALNRLQGTLLEYSPALGAAFDYAHSQGALLLLTMYPTPEAIRAAGPAEIERDLRRAGARRSAQLAARATEAAADQSIRLPGEQLAAAIAVELAQTTLNLFAAVATIEKSIRAAFLKHRHAEILLSMPGLGQTLGAELLAATGGNMQMYVTANRFASVCGLAPVARDSGRITQNHRRPKRFDRRLLRVCYLSAYRAIRDDDRARKYYDRKRSEGKTHIQAILALARRRSDVLWAMLRDNQLYQPLARTERPSIHPEGPATPRPR
ncbi:MULTISPECIES: IS110 family transposase [Nocardia]|uniref:IS110 family transposase n=1 Tax=Nocardia TaxID=1817 RepID=UPI0007A55390|nr:MULTISPECIES: IS110 family transposase [Nocardia]MBF6276379.1 IS110 family transposase [Nocardia nova]OBA46013.1 transposase [Nocardia sp. 852002-51101_SCH5132738]OBB38598.1 transposase [Nocardia sp. 852002-51244_SCH5132740]OBF82926.1 transposase [Mycobacterium sp. 852002-51759_SCH5129042]